MDEQKKQELKVMRQTAISKGDEWSITLFNCFVNTLGLDESTTREFEIEKEKKEIKNKCS